MAAVIAGALNVIGIGIGIGIGIATAVEAGSLVSGVAPEQLLSRLIEYFSLDMHAPSTGEVRSDEADNIAYWLIGCDYNSESFFVRQV